MKLKFKSTFVMSLAALITAACGGGQNSGGFVAAPSNGGGTGTGGTGGTVSNTGMYISLVTLDQPITAYLHPFYQFGSSSCMIPASSTGVDMQCVLNVRELDLYTQGLKLDLNVPSGMCDYVSDMPYAYYNFRAGVGASSIQVVYNANSPGSATCSVKNAAGVAETGVTIDSSGLCTFKEGTADAQGNVTCAYDYSSGTNPSGKNGCEGTYNYTGTYTAPGSPAPTPVTTTLLKQSWKGKSSYLLAGPYTATGSGFSYNTTTNQYYEQIRVANTLGFNQYYTLQAPIKLQSASNVYLANFWDWTSYSAAGNNGLSTAPANMPYAIQNYADLSGNYPSSFPHTSYEFRCYDTAMEIKNRIRVYINEWDNNASFAAYAASNGALTNSPIDRRVGSGLCSSINEYCDDIGSWEDDGSVGTPADLRTSWPQEDITTK